MKNIGITTLFLAVALMLVQACGPSEAEKRAAEKARLDSLRAVQEQLIAEQMAALQDSLDRAEAQQQTAEVEKSTYRFSENGEYAVQVGAFRSESKANGFLNKWSDRDYPSVYVVKIGSEETGDVWFRLRVGFFDNAEDAAVLGRELADEINSDFWVSKIERSNP